MAKREIIWSKFAKTQLKTILEYYLLINGNSNYSLKLLSEIENILDTLSKAAFIGRLTDNKCTRVIPMKVYLIFYEINGNNIEIISFWDNRQDIESRKVK